MIAVLVSTSGDRPAVAQALLDALCDYVAKTVIGPPLPCGSTPMTALLRLHDQDGMVTVLWTCRHAFEAYASVIDKSLWDRGCGRNITHVAADEQAAMSGRDGTWRTWLIEPLEDMPSPSAMSH